MHTIKNRGEGQSSNQAIKLNQIKINKTHVNDDLLPLLRLHRLNRTYLDSAGQLAHFVDP